MFLYILNMNKEKMIKIGIATGIARIKQHLRTYNKLINLKESYIVTAKDDNTIRMLERQFLNDYKEFAIDNNKFNNLDGATELRKIEILDDVLEDIQYKSCKLKLKNIKIKKGIAIENKIQTKNTSNHDKFVNSKAKINITEMDHLHNINQIEKFIGYLIKYKDNIVNINFSKENIIEQITLKFKKNEYESIGIVGLDSQRGGCNLTQYEANYYNNDSIVLILNINSKSKNFHRSDGLSYYINMFLENLKKVLQDISI